jgi:hypothetical protein
VDGNRRELVSMQNPKPECKQISALLKVFGNPTRPLRDFRSPGALQVSENGLFKADFAPSSPVPFARCCTG